MELVTKNDRPLIIEYGFELAIYCDDNGAISIGLESVGPSNKNGMNNPENFEPIRDALVYMMEHPSEDNNLDSVADNLQIILHRPDGDIVKTSNGVLYNAEMKNFYFVGIGCDSPYIELFYNFMQEHLERVMNHVTNNGSSILDRPLPSGFEREEDERFLKAIPHHKPRKNLKLRTAFDYVSSGMFVFAYTKEEEPYIHHFAQITGISDDLVRKGMYEFYHYVTIQDRMMVPVRKCNWDNIISCKALLRKMQK
jgi:hypothetical protein